MPRAKAKKPAAPTVPREPVAPPRKRFIPPWYTRRSTWVQHTSHRPRIWVEMVLGGELRLPKFQRAYVWTDEQIIGLLESLLHGEHVGTLLLWEQHTLPPSTERFADVVVESAGNRAAYVIDGQQRLCALATAAKSGRFYFDMMRGAFGMMPGPWMMPVALMLTGRISDALDWNAAHAAEHGLDLELVEDLFCRSIDAIDNTGITATLLPREWTTERAVATFQKMNSTGTPISAEELAAALART